MIRKTIFSSFIVFSILSGLAFAATEDFTTYTEQDEGADLTVTSTRVTGTSMETNGDKFYVQKDFGASHFTDFSHLLTVTQTADSTDSLWGVWAMGNVSGDLEDLNVNGTGLQLFYLDNDQLGIYDISTDSYDESTGLSNSTVYYLTISRSGTTFTCQIYSNSGRTTLVDTISITSVSTAFRYLKVVAGLDIAGVGKTASGYVENLDVQEAAGSARRVMVVQ